MKKHARRVLVLLVVAMSAILAGCGAGATSAQGGRLYIIGIEAKPTTGSPTPLPPPPPSTP
ncbi:MAG: hypothetical protein HZB16_01710 [Armatimonadetes bacterium]|nr:hypothetical protein [Armatimonadota bacterium]